jgi:hypothetical protein
MTHESFARRARGLRAFCMARPLSGGAGALAFAFAAIALIPGAVSAQQAGTAPAAALAAHDSARIDWERGNYISALTRWERLLSGGDAAALNKDIALVTGEWHPAREVSEDGRNPRWSPDGSLLAYTTTLGGAAETRVVRVDGAGIREVARTAGAQPVYSADGATLYVIRVRETAAIRAAQAELEAAADAAARRRAMMSIAQAEREASQVVARALNGGRERVLSLPEGLVPVALAPSASGGVNVVASVPSRPRESRLLRVDAGEVRSLSAANEGAVAGATSAPGVTAWMIAREANPPMGGQAGPALVLLHDDGRRSVRPARAFALSADGSRVVWLTQERGANELRVAGLGSDTASMTVLRTTLPVVNPAISHDGSWVAYQTMLREDWEVFVWNDGLSEPRRLTRESQHDLFPRFVSNGRLLAVMGEARHRRSYLYDLETGARERLFHNDLVRTVSPEYEWEVSPDGSRVAIVAERDGDTITPERALHVTDLRVTVAPDELLRRVRGQLATETELRERGEKMFGPIAQAVKAMVADVSVDRIYHYADTLHSYGSKYIGTPGNLKAIEYLSQKLRSFGYEPELQWFEPNPNVRTANVIARIPGTENPELVYVVSSHFDSVRDGPGADDNSSGTTALLEVARVLASRPQPATIELAFFTGEEAGLLGSREYVRRAVADGKRIVGALNNDMVGYKNDQRMDNTIRYSNDGLRDLQHAAAFLFTDLITYDARYYKNTDAHAYYEAYGDIVGGIGSYPILGNPHYHQTHDVLETIDQQLVAEVAKTTAASLMLMASSPARLPNVTMRRSSGALEVSWSPAAEKSVTGYEVAYGPANNPFARTISVTEPRVRLTDAPAGAVVRVRAVSANGTRGWDWQRAGNQ